MKVLDTLIVISGKKTKSRCVSTGMHHAPRWIGYKIVCSFSWKAVGHIPFVRGISVDGDSIPIDDLEHRSKFDIKLSET